MTRNELQPDWLPNWAFNLAARAVGIGLTLALWPLMTAACFADLVVNRDLRDDDG